jgi:hypothetical protein
MTPNPVLNPATAASANVQVNCGEDDKVIFAVNGTALSGGDTITFSIANSSAGKTPIYDASGAQVALTASLQSVMLEGGFLYVIDKSITAAASGLDVSHKPRIY